MRGYGFNVIKLVHVTQVMRVAGAYAKVLDQARAKVNYPAMHFKVGAVHPGVLYDRCFTKVIHLLGNVQLNQAVNLGFIICNTVKLVGV